MYIFLLSSKKGKWEYSWHPSPKDSKIFLILFYATISSQKPVLFYSDHTTRGTHGIWFHGNHVGEDENDPSNGSQIIFLRIRIKSL